MIRVQTKTIGVRKRTGLLSGIVRNEPGMVINLIFEIFPENSCILLGIPDYNNNQWGPLGGLGCGQELSGMNQE